MKDAIEVPLFPYGLFQASWVGTSKGTGLICFLCPSARTRQKGRDVYKRQEYTLITTNMAAGNDGGGVLLDMDGKMIGNKIGRAHV